MRQRHPTSEHRRTPETILRVSSHDQSPADRYHPADLQTSLAALKWGNLRFNNENFLNAKEMNTELYSVFLSTELDVCVCER